MWPMVELDDDLASVFPDCPGHSSTDVDRQLAGGSMTGFIKNFQDLFPRNPNPEIVMQYLQRRHQPLSYFFDRELPQHAAARASRPCAGAAR